MPFYRKNRLKPKPQFDRNDIRQIRNFLNNWEVSGGTLSFDGQTARLRVNTPTVASTRSREQFELYSDALNQVKIASGLMYSVPPDWDVEDGRLSATDATEIAIGNTGTKGTGIFRFAGKTISSLSNSTNYDILIKATYTSSAYDDGSDWWEFWYPTNYEYEANISSYSSDDDFYSSADPTYIHPMEGGGTSGTCTMFFPIGRVNVGDFGDVQVDVQLQRGPITDRFAGQHAFVDND